MDLIIACVLGFILWWRWETDRTNKKIADARWEHHQSVWEQINEYSNRDAEREVRSLLSDPTTRLQCFDLIDKEMQYIWGEKSWRDRYDNFKSNWFFQNHLSTSDPSDCLHPENIVYYVMLATRGIAAFSAMSLHKIVEMPINSDTYDIIKRMCLVVEELLKKHHPNLENELDLFIYPSQGYEAITFRFAINYDPRDRDKKRLTK